MCKKIKEAEIFKDFPIQMTMQILIINTLQKKK